MNNQATLSSKELEAIKAIRNAIASKGRLPSLRELMASLHYRSPRSSSLMFNRLEFKGILKKKKNGSFQFIDLGDNSIHAQTVNVPLVGIVSCGMPIFAEENIEAMIPVSNRLAKPNAKHFLLRASGDSMNKAGINNGDLVLVRQQQTAKNGDWIVALVDDGVTIKELSISENAVLLKPRSTNKEHKPIILDRDFKIQGVVVTVIPNFEGKK
jgi:repressor LexA